MKVSWRWLRELAPGIPGTPDDAMAALARRGAPVEGVEDPAEGLRDVVVGQVLEARPHPNADRLTLCRVRGASGEDPVVCGAPNVRPGAFYPFAPVGAVLPGGFRIGKRRIRGQLSRGMLCSERELGLGEDHAGIMRLAGVHEVGTPFAAAVGLDDLRFDVEVTPNRGDLLSHLGIARELHPKGQAAIRLPAVGDFPMPAPAFARGGSQAEAGGVRIEIEDGDLCTRYLGAVIRGVKVGPSPLWLANRLRAAGARPINNIVDATNYVMLELGQPLHAFDLDRLAGSTVIVGRARPDETLRTLDGVERKLSPGMLTIRDARAPIAIAGVMGGEDSEVTAATRDVLLECALFEPKQVRATRRALAISTDASYRFERGVDPTMMETALVRAAGLIAALGGGSVDARAIDVHPAPWRPPVVPLRPSRVGRVLGVPFAAGRIAGLLRPLGYSVVREEEDALHFAVPGHRSYDTLREVDLIEEVARTHGYDAFPSELAPFRPGTVPDDALFRLEDRLRARLAADGISEAQTPALGPAASGDVALLNPMSGEESRLRRDRLSGLLTHLERNLARGVRDVRLFELGTAFAPGGDPSSPPVESARVAVVLHGRRAPLQWAQEGGRFDVFDGARVLEAIAQEAWPGGRVVPSAVPDAPPGAGDGAPGEPDPSPYRPGRSYELRDRAGRVVGRGGEVRPGRMDLPRWAGAVVGGEAILPSSPGTSPAVTARDLADQPASERDVAFLLPPGTPAGDVLRAARKGGGRLLEDAVLFDLYQGSDLPGGARSVAIRLRFRAHGRTLTDREVDRSLRRVLRKVKEATGVEPRR